MKETGERGSNAAYGIECDEERHWQLMLDTREERALEYHECSSEQPTCMKEPLREHAW